MRLRCVSFNVLADAYLSYGDYSHVAPELLLPGARIPHLLRLLADLQADVICLQEVEAPLVDALRSVNGWQLFWTPKPNGKSDGCLMLVKQALAVTDFVNYVYSDSSSTILQHATINGVCFANTHIRWAPADAVPHVGVAQTREMLLVLGRQRPAVIFGDCNDRPGGPVRSLVGDAGFINTCGDMPTALIGPERAALDLLAVRGVKAEHITTTFRPEDIPSVACPSDHIPVMAYIEMS